MSSGAIPPPIQRSSRSLASQPTSQARDTASDTKAGPEVPARGEPRAQRVALPGYRLKTGLLQLIGSVAPQGRRMPASPVDQMLPVYDQLMQVPDVDDKGDGAGVLSDLMGVVRGYLGEPSLREHLARIEGMPAQQQLSQRRLGDLGAAYVRVSGDDVCRMPVGTQLMVGPRGNDPDTLYSPAVRLGLTSVGDILVQSAFRGSAFQRQTDRESASFDEIVSWTSPDGWGHVVSIPPSGAGVSFLRSMDAPLVLDEARLLDLIEGTRLLIQIPYAGGRGLTAAQPAIFLGARPLDDGRVMLRVRAPWAPAHTDPGGQVSHRHTAIFTAMGDTEMQLRTTGDVPQPHDYAIGPGPGDPPPGVSEGWFEWEAPLPAKAVVVVNPYFGPPPDLKAGGRAARVPPEAGLHEPEDPGDLEDSSHGDVHETKARHDEDSGIGESATPKQALTHTTTAQPGGLSHVQCINLAPGTAVRVTGADGAAVTAEFAGAADAWTEEPNAIWVVAPRGALPGAGRSATVPGEPDNMSYLLSLSTHRVELAGA